MAKIMGLVVTGTERQGRLVQGGETEAKGQKRQSTGKERKPSLRRALHRLRGIVWVGGHFTRTFPDSLTMLAWNCRVGSDLIDPLEGGQKKEEWPVVLVWPSTLLAFAPRLGQCHQCNPFTSKLQVQAANNTRHQAFYSPTWNVTSFAKHTCASAIKCTSESTK